VGPTRVVLALVTRSERLTPIPPTAYPHYGVLERWSLEYPWIVGIVHLRTPPTDWKLWVGNVITGRHLILDHGNGPNRTIVRQYPDFALNAGRVVWDDTQYCDTAHCLTAQTSRRLHNRLDLYNLRTGQKTFIAPTPATGSIYYYQPTLWGTTIVWVRGMGFPGTRLHPVYDLLRYQLDSGRITNLTHNTQLSGVSSEPSLWRHYLLFTQSPAFTSTGDIVLWDLSSGHFPLWRKPGETLLDVWGEMPRWGDGIAWWQAEYQATPALFLAGTDTVWTFEYGPHAGLPQYYQYDWEVQTGGGRNVVVERSRSGIGWPASQPTYFVWQLPAVKGGSYR
jgi:hypothetical protein